MKQIRFKHLVTLGLCCSLLVNSITGITAIAETVTIESSPTAETEKKTKVEQTEQTKEAKNQQEHKETDVTSQDTSEEDNQKEVAQPTEATTSSLEESLPKIESRGIPLKTIVYPKVQYDFVDETGAPFTTPLSFSGNYQARAGSQAGTPVALPAPYNKLSAQANGTGSYILSINNSAGFPLTPQVIEKYGAGGSTPNTKYRVEFMLDKLNIATSLKFVDSIKYAPASSYWSIYGYKGFNLTTGIFDNSMEEGRIEKYTLQDVRDSTFKINTLGSFEIVQPVSLSIASGGFREWVAPGYESILLRGFDGTNTIKSKMVYIVTRKQVTEKFVDGTGMAITPPTGFTQNKKTPMTSNNFTYTSAKALPDTYKASNGKTYKFKGWYKGKTKPATLKTTKTPSYAVTYDNNDDLNVVYEVDTAKDYKFPSRTVNFQFVNEAGAILLPTPFTITTDLQQEINSTYTKLGSITGTNSGNTKQVTIPARTIKADVSLGGVNNYGTTNTRITIPKFYENISLYTGSAYTQALFNQYSTVGNTLIGAPNNNAPLYYGLSKVTATQFKMNEFASGANYMYSRLFVATNQYKLESYYTTVGTVYYQLTNRKVTENFVDTNGVKITAPTGFTQGKKTNITNTDYTFTQSGTLPSTYKTSNGKVYKLKGWYKGNTKPATLNTGKPTYKVTYNNNDDLNVVYEETSKDYKFPSRTVNFQFVNEAGAILLPTPFTITTDLQQEINSTYTKLGSITGTNSGNTKQVTIPARTIKADVSLGGVNNYGTTNTRITIPKFYENISLYTGSTYTQATLNEYSTVGNTLIGAPHNNAPLYYGLSKVTATQFKMNEFASGSNYMYSRLFVATNPYKLESYYTTVGTVYYQLTNRKVTENFVDTNGVKITAPTGFTQGKKTNITNTDYTFTQSGTLPSTYKTSNGKVYKLKGWYKGNTKPATLNTGKPTYKVTYNNNDDLNVVYEETSKDYKFPSKTVNFQFVNEAGTIISPTPFTITTDLQQEINSTYTKLGSITGTNSGNTKQVTIPARTIKADVSLGGVNNYGTTNTRITIPKFYENISLYTGSTYTQATLNEYLTVNNAPGKPVNNPPLHYGLSKVTATQFKISEVTNGSNYRYSRLFAASNQYNLEKYYTPVGTIYYQLTNRKVTENFVDASGTKITPPTGFTQGNQIPMTSDTFKYTSAKVLPASYSAGGKTYVFQGWYKGKNKPNTLTTSTTPTYDTTFDDNDDMTAVYKEASISANLTMRGAVDVIDNGGTMEYWEVLLKNTGEAPLTSIKIKPTTDWESGISTPTELFILGTGQNTKVRPITKEQWEAGFEIPLDKSLPVGGQLTINLIGTKVTGQPNQVLKAAVEVSGNFNKLTASDTVRIKDLDQETKEPTGEGFISVPTFDFGQVGVASATKQHGLKKAADYYGNGTRNPYVRISKTQPNWSLTAQLSQPKSATDSLPTATRLILGQVPIYSVGNYNLPTELMTSVGVTRSLGLTADNSSVSIIGNQEFSGADVYQLDFQFDKVKLEVPANQGVKGQQYQAAVTWNLVTGP
ncbi:WxL domain-containing protein [Enterococcus faecalis]|uniref:WxL domain-containing protein n=1 Tax=Enterococcus faecalis TaxID=1351 RepID=UPI003F8DBB11